MGAKIGSICPFLFGGVSRRSIQVMGCRMNALTVDRRIKFQEELNPEFGREIAATPGGENLARCIQCGTCSATCPMSIYMDHTPRRIIAMTRAGFEHEVLSSNTIWLCASCYACTVQCPKDIKITDVMYALKQRAIAKKSYPRRFTIPVLAREFFKTVQRTGRSNEVRTSAWMMLKTNPLNILRNAPLGLKLLRRGRLSMKTERVTKGMDQMRAMLASVEASERRAS